MPHTNSETAEQITHLPRRQKTWYRSIKTKRAIPVPPQMVEELHRLSRRYLQADLGKLAGISAGTIGRAMRGWDLAPESIEAIKVAIQRAHEIEGRPQKREVQPEDGEDVRITTIISMLADCVARSPTDRPWARAVLRTMLEQTPLNSKEKDQIATLLG